MKHPLKRTTLGAAVFLAVCGSVSAAQDGVRGTPGGGVSGGAGGTPGAPKTGEARAMLPVAARGADGKTLVVPEAHRKLGAVFGSVNTERSEMKVTSESAIEKFSGSTREAAGYLVIADVAGALKGDVAPKVPAGAFRVACGSIKTGIALRDEHMLGERWLDAERHPDITFAVTGFTNATRGLEGGVGGVWVGTLAGELSIRGQTRAIEVAGARIELAPGTDGLKKGVAPMPPTVTITCRFDVALRDYGMDASVLGVSVAERMRIDETIVLTP